MRARGAQVVEDSRGSMAEDNHYVPIFYQKRWAIRPDRRVCVYSRPYKDVHVQRKHPKGVGYQR